MIEAYPLSWPLNKRRTPNAERKRALFKIDGRSLSVYNAVSRIKSELNKYTKVGQKFRVPSDSIIISTNIPVKKDGTPYSNYREPDDVGVAVYFKLDSKDYCLPCDKWNSVADNLAAVAAHLSAMRGIERWGVGESHDIFTGFKALPEQTSGTPWWDVLQCRPDASEDLIRAQYKRLAMDYHPDKNGGDSSKFLILQQAYQQALKK